MIHLQGGSGARFGRTIAPTNLPLKENRNWGFAIIARAPAVSRLGFPACRH